MKLIFEPIEFYNKWELDGPFFHGLVYEYTEC